ncbi:hypothetical protein ACFLUA_00850 [Chloroflexota bacterium]
MIKSLQGRGVYLKDIAEELGVHPKTVGRALKRGRAPNKMRKKRGSKLDTCKATVDRLHFQKFDIGRKKVIQCWFISKKIGVEVFLIIVGENCYYNCVCAQFVLLAPDHIEVPGFGVDYPLSALELVFDSQD